MCVLFALSVWSQVILMQSWQVWLPRCGVTGEVGVKYEHRRVTAASWCLRNVLGRGKALDGLCITLHRLPEKWAVWLKRVGWWARCRRAMAGILLKRSAGVSKTVEIACVTPGWGEGPLNVLLIEFRSYVKCGRKRFEHSAFPSSSVPPPLSCSQAGCPLSNCHTHHL